MEQQLPLVPTRPLLEVCRAVVHASAICFLLHRYAGSVQDLLKAIQKEEVRVHVAIAARIDEIGLKASCGRVCLCVCAHLVARLFCIQDLAPDLHPTSLVADTVAGQIAKVRKVRAVVCVLLPVVLSASRLHHSRLQGLLNSKYSPSSLCHFSCLAGLLLLQSKERAVTLVKSLRRSSTRCWTWCG